MNAMSVNMDQDPASPERGPAPDMPEPRVNDTGEDLLIERPDIGEGCTTLVVAGDPIPAALVGLPARSRVTGKPIKAAGR